MNYIKTNDTKTGAVQFWAARLQNLNTQHTSHLLSHYGERADLYKLDKSVEQIENSGLGEVRLIPLSITEEEITHLDGYSFGQAIIREYDDDAKPFTYRLKRIAEVEGQLGLGVDSPIWFRSTRYNDSLSPGQKAWLVERFGVELRAGVTSALLIKLKRDAVKWIVEYAKKEVANYRRQLDEIEAYEAKNGGAK